MIQRQDSKLSIWEEHPDLISGVIADLYKKDKTKGKKRSSSIMWCIVMIYDDESKYYNLPKDGVEGKFAIVFGDFLKDEEFYQKNKELVDELGLYYEKLCSTPAKRHLKSIEELLDNRTKYLNENKYTMLPSIKEAVEFDKLVVNTDKLTETYEKAVKRLSNEKETRVKGNAKRSLSDNDDI